MKFAPHERQIAKGFGLTPAMLLSLFRAKARDGHAQGPGMGQETISCRRPLHERGLLHENRMTARAYEIVAEARRLGW